MTGARKGWPVPPETLAEGRRLYETTDQSRREIAQAMGVHPHTVTRIAKRQGWSAAGSLAPRNLAIRRIRAGVEEQIATVEGMFGAHAGSLDETDRAARTLASLVRSLRELQKFDAEARGIAEDEQEDGAPADIDALRDALADRLARLQAGGD